MYQNSKTQYDQYGIPVVHDPYGRVESSTQMHAGAPVVIAQPIYDENFQQSVQVQALKPAAPTVTGWRDWPFALLFFINVVAMIVLLFLWGLPVIRGDTNTKSGVSFLTNKEAQTALIMSGGLSAIAAVISIVMLKLVVTYSACMITFSLW